MGLGFAKEVLDVRHEEVVLRRACPIGLATIHESPIESSSGGESAEYAQAGTREPERRAT